MTKTVYLTYRVDFSFDESQISEESAVSLIGENYMEPNNKHIQIDHREFAYPSCL